MNRSVIALCFWCISSVSSAQGPITWLNPQTVNTTIGTDWPRVAISHSRVIVAWGEFTSGTLLCRSFSNGSFGTEKILTPPGYAAAVFGLTGPDLKASGDSVFIVYAGYDGFHAYLQHSYDGGNTFSDTIRIDNIAGYYPQYPSLDIMPGGNPIISYAKLDFGFSDPQYVVTKSLDGGNTFSNPVDATLAVGANPCDCCPGTMVYRNNVACVIYRNSINNQRDMRVAISFDNAQTFSEVGNIDNNGWFFDSCPSIGGDGDLQGDTLISVFMNGLNGQKCYVSTLNVNTLQPGFQKQLFNLPDAGLQTHPRMAIKGDTMAVVWEQNIGSDRNIMFTYSLTGAAGLGQTVDTLSNILTDGFHTNPDIAYSDGKFYVVYADPILNKIYLMQGILYGTTGIDNTSAGLPSIQLSGDFEGNQIRIVNGESIHEPGVITIFSATGMPCESHVFPAFNKSQPIHLDHPLSNGLYFISLQTDSGVYTGKFIVSH